MMTRSWRAFTLQLASRIKPALSSKRFWYIILGLFVGQALWFALTAKYPMAFDEDFHFGLIRLHAGQVLPFFTSQPAHAEQFGAIVRDPSYLYHFLMSLPYRLIALVTSSQTTQIIGLRFINIAMACGSLVLARKLLIRLGGSLALVQLSLLIFILVPIVPFLAAHINYDNLFILLTLWSVLATFGWLDQLAEHKISAPQTVLLFSLFMLAGIVKYAYLPIACGLGAIMLWAMWRQRQYIPALLENARQSVLSARKWHLVLVATIVLLSAGLFSERYAVNLVRYRAPNPDCGQVLTVQDCLHYSPWARDYNLALSKPANYHPNRLTYIADWFYGMWLRSFFAISDTYDTQPPLPLPSGTVIAIGGAGLILFAWFGRRLLRGNIYRQAIVLTVVLYVGALFLQTFQGYLKTGEPVAINGRYLLPFLPAVILFVGLAYSWLWRRQPALKAGIAVIVLLLFLQGGGVLTFILRSSDTWDWPNDVVVQVNHTVRETLKPFVVGAESGGANH